MALAVIGCLTGCGGSGSAPSSVTPTARSAPDIAGFLKLPVATPRVCPSGVSGSTVGRSSPWAGHVDVSIFLATTATPAQTARLAATVKAQPLVRTVYVESPAEAHAEFERLYTCSAAVPVSQTPASYRLVLRPGVTVASRNGLVARLLVLPGVDSISCDPSAPCTAVVRPPQPTGPSPSP